MLNLTDWNGVVIGYGNGKTAKGVMRFLGKEDGLDVWERTDGREYRVNRVGELAAYMIDPLNIPSEYNRAQVMETQTARTWLSNNTYRGDKE